MQSDFNPQAEQNPATDKQKKEETAFHSTLETSRNGNCEKNGNKKKRRHILAVVKVKFLLLLLLQNLYYMYQFVL